MSTTLANPELSESDGKPTITTLGRQLAQGTNVGGQMVSEEIVTQLCGLQIGNATDEESLASSDVSHHER